MAMSFSSGAIAVNGRAKAPKMRNVPCVLRSLNNFLSICKINYKHKHKHKNRFITRLLVLTPLGAKLYAAAASIAVKVAMKVGA